MTTTPDAPDNHRRALSATVKTCLVVAAGMSLAAAAAVAVFWFFVFVPCSEGISP